MSAGVCPGLDGRGPVAAGPDAGPLPTNDASTKSWSVESGSIAALWLANYDVPLAREVLSRVDAAEALNFSRAYPPALALLHGDRFEAFLEQMTNPNMRKAGCNAAAAMLAATGNDLHREIHGVSLLWMIDVEDLFW